MSQYNSKEFIQLQTEWYKKLAQSGFEDAEDFSAEYGNYNNPYITRSCKDLAKKYNKETFQHYQYCRDFLSSGRFASKTDETIWAFYTSGDSLRTIAEKLSHIGVHKSYFWVFEQLKRMKEDLKQFLIDQDKEV